jgi:hypothetical protein
MAQVKTSAAATLVAVLPAFALRASADKPPTHVAQANGAGETREADVIDLAFQSTLAAEDREALERLMFFNHRQRQAETAITRAVERFGSPAIVSDAGRLRVAVGNGADVQCLFAIEHGRRSDALAGMVVYLRTSIDEVLVLHIAVADRYGRKGLEVVAALVRAVRAAAQRLRGVERLTMLDLQGRELRITIQSPRSPSIGQLHLTDARVAATLPARAS